jgi:integrase
MPMLEVPRLYRNRCGVFCFRLRSGAVDARFSLRTKCPLVAHILARSLNTAIDAAKGEGMTSKNPNLSDLDVDWKALRRYEIDIKNGVFKTDGSDRDHVNLLDAVGRIGMIPEGEFRPAKPSAPAATSAPETSETAPATLPKSGGDTLDAVAKLWLAERTQKNAPRTVYAKGRHFEDFAKHVDRNLGINSVDKKTIVNYKNALIAGGQVAKTADNKLMTMHDMFEYAIANGLYSASAANPVKGVFILDKAERKAKTAPYQPFELEDIAKIFEPTAYKLGMTEPDYYWGPLIGLFTGMRISEATAIRCRDVKKAPNGVDHIHVPKSKTTAGVRNVPIHDALIKLGFLDFVAKQAAAGHDRIFPDRLLINDSYSKKLSEQMKNWLVVRGVKHKNDHKSFHSFRVNVITMLTDEGANTAQIMKIVGHKSAGADDVHLGYVRELPKLVKVVNRLKWPIDTVGLLR